MAVKNDGIAAVNMDECSGCMNGNGPICLFQKSKDLRATYVDCMGIFSSPSMGLGVTFGMNF